VDYVWLALAILLLSAGAEALVRGASALARRMGLSLFAIGLTVVGFGTSSPEMFTSVAAGLAGRGDLAVGNVVGSNSFNIGAILGLTALLAPIPIPRALVRGESWIVLLTALVPFLALVLGGVLPRWLGVTLVLLLAAYVRRAYLAGKTQAAQPAAEAQAAGDLHLDRPEALAHPVRSLLLALAGLVLLVFGADLLVSSASTIARGMGVSELAIGLTIVAAGTSAPELVTSLVAAYRGHSELALGNVLGSNVFNVLGVLGATTALTPQRVAEQVTTFDGPVMVAFSAAMLLLAYTRARIGRVEGLLLLLGYVVYVVVLLGRAP
jgi:cation:H+ antiporter